MFPVLPHWHTGLTVLERGWVQGQLRTSQCAGTGCYRVVLFSSLYQALRAKGFAETGLLLETEAHSVAWRLVSLQWPSCIAELTTASPKGAPCVTWVFVVLLVGGLGNAPRTVIAANSALELSAYTVYVVSTNRPARQEAERGEGAYGKEKSGGHNGFSSSHQKTALTLLKRRL